MTTILRTLKASIVIVGATFAIYAAPVSAAPLAPMPLGVQAAADNPVTLVAKHKNVAKTPTKKNAGSGSATSNPPSQTQTPPPAGNGY